MDKKEMRVRLCEKMLRQGYPKSKILDKIGPGAQEIYEIAKCRIKMKNKFSVHELYFDEYGLRYSTPEVIGQFRAERIKNFRIADLSCGAGLQAIFFSFTNKEVIGVELSEKRIEYARRNAAAYNATNVRFIQGDCLTDRIYNIVKDYDILFSDPARAESESERRLETLLPSPLRIMKKYGSSGNYIFDLPPQMAMDKIPTHWEKEYISLNGRITRLTAYIGEIKTHDRVAVSLPKKGVFWTDESPHNEKLIINSLKLSDYVYIVDESLYYAKLLGEFQKKYPLEYLKVGKRRTLATGDWIDSPFLTPYLVLCKSHTLENIVECLNRESIGKVTLRFELPPGEYWTLRKKIESKLSGNDRGSIFRIGEIWIATKNVT